MCRIIIDGLYDIAFFNYKIVKSAPFQLDPRRCPHGPAPMMMVSMYFMDSSFLFRNDKF